MSAPNLPFDNADVYEKGMGSWTVLAGDPFLDWLAQSPGLRWLDVGCGNGAFTERIARETAPSEVMGVDPAAAMLAYARERPGARGVGFQSGSAMALPFPDNRFDVATMALVTCFVPEPAKGVAELARVVRPDGIVAAYFWDMPGGGFPYQPIVAELRAMGFVPGWPPHPEASEIATMRDLWIAAGLADVEVRRIDIRRAFADFDAVWENCEANQNARIVFSQMTSAQMKELKDRLRARMPAPDGSGQIVLGAWANAAKGRVPG